MSALYVAGLLALALAFFWASKFQFRWFVRLGLIVLGAGALVGAAIQAPALDATGLLALAADFIRDPNNSIVLAALTANAASGVGRSFPLLGLFVLLTAALGIAALLALAPGKTFDRIAQGVGVGVIGMIAGAALALAVVAIGFGGPIKQRVYVGQIKLEETREKHRPESKDVQDGDTFRMGDVSIRLNGIDAPESGQFCWNAAGEKDVSCSEQARQHLINLLAGEIVVCVPPAGKAIAKETFGRPILDCRLQGDAQPDQLNRRMVEHGFAVSYRGSEKTEFFAGRDGVAGYGPLEEKAAQTAAGLMRSCFLDPKIWRRAEGREDRQSFEGGKLDKINIKAGIDPKDPVNKKLFGAACSNLIKSAPEKIAPAEPPSIK